MTLTRLKAFWNLLSSVALLMPILSAHAQEWSFGPIPIRNQFPITIYRNGSAPGSPELPGERKWRIITSYVASNTFVEEDDYLIDAESHAVDAGFEYGIYRDFSLSLSLPIIWFGGGKLDRPIDKWHKALGLPPGHREESPRNALNLSGKNKDQSKFEFDDQGWNLGNLDIGLKWLVEKGSRNFPAAAFRLSASAPSATSNDAPGGSDIIAGILLSKGLNPFYLYAGSSLVFLTDIEQSGISYSRTYFEGFFDTEYDVYHYLALLCGVRMQETPFKNMEENNQMVIYLDTALKYAPNESWSLAFLVRENPLGRLTTDISFLLGVEFHL